MGAGQPALRALRAQQAGARVLLPRPGQSVEPEVGQPAVGRWWPSLPWETAARHPIVSGGLETPRDGFLQLPTEPGLGIQVNEAALEKYHAA